MTLRTSNGRVCKVIVFTPIDQGLGWDLKASLI